VKKLENRNWQNSNTILKSRCQKPSWKNEYVKNVQGFAIKFEGSVEQSYQVGKSNDPTLN
jgi:hypothetical protein